MDIEANALIKNNQQPQVTNDKNQRIKFQLCQCFKPLPEPILNWEFHQEKVLYSEFLEFMEQRFAEVKRLSSNYKYNVKIGLQVFIYILNGLELFFTLYYNTYNQIEKGLFLDCYLLSIIVCILLHCATWMYTYKFRKIAKKNFFEEAANYLFYILLGLLSYLKLAPFLYFYNRDESIKQFSFSEINKYLILDGEDKFRNPSRLFKKRTKKNVNMFRDLIFHRIALVSMIITMCLQTFPQIIIQGFYNTKQNLWNDGFNVVGYLLLIGNLIYYLLELQFIVFTTTYRQMQTELQFKLQKIKIKFIQETKQLLKSDQQYMGFFVSFYFHIDPSTFSSYQKKRCLVQIITFLTRQKKFKNIQILFIDQYETVTLQYLKNCFKVIQVEKISLFYKEKTKLKEIEDIFQRNQIPNLTLQEQIGQNIDQLWISDKIDFNAEEQKVEIQFIENKKINAGWEALQMNQSRQSVHAPISEEFTNFIKDQQLLKNTRETPEKIASEAQDIIQNITKRSILEEKLGTYFLKLYECYEYLSRLIEWQLIIQLFWSLLNGALQIISLFYISEDPDMFRIALIVLTTVNPAIQLCSFALFQYRALQQFSFNKQVFNTILFGICNFFKFWDIMMIALYRSSKQFNLLVQRGFSGEAYIKFKSYASKFEGSLPISVFQYKAVQVDPKSILDIKQQPFYQAVMWRTSVEEALNKIPQFFIYVLALSSDSNGVTFLWVASFLQQLKEGIIAIKDILEVVIKDFLIPAQILSTVSVEQFFQSMLYLSSISNQMLLEYPKSFQIMSKVKEEYLKEKCTFKINLINLNFSNYNRKKKEKILAQFRYVLASIQNILEIDQAQKIFYMGPEINDFLRCLIVSPIYQLKLNFYLDEVNPEQIPHINTFIQYCPQNLQFLQISIEPTDQIQLNLKIGQMGSLKSFSYSYCQIIKQHNDYAQIGILKNLHINKQFLTLDKYNFEQLYFEIAGSLILDNCDEFFKSFTQMKFLKISLKNNNHLIQTFQFTKNLQNQGLDTLDISFEYIKLDFQQFPFHTLKGVKLIMKKCEFKKEDLKKILDKLEFDITKSVYIEMISCQYCFTEQERKNILKSLEAKKIDVTIKIEK